MSLKAKIEAVIYASEEPVTLAQLIGLLGQEAQDELDALDAAQQSLALESEDPGSPATQDADDEAAATQDASDEATLELAAASENAAAEVAEAEAAPEAQPAESSEAAEAAARSRQEKETARRLREFFRSLLEQLIAEYANGDRGLEIREVASGYRMGTKPEYHDAVRGFIKSLKPPLKLSLPALETLAVIAYKQPITAPEIGEIRGVDSGGVLGSLVARKLITTAGRKQVIGRPILYKTTKDFLLRFGLKDVAELPSIEEFERMAGELNEQEEIPMDEATPHHVPSADSEDGDDPTPEHHVPETPGELESQRHTHLPQADGSPDPTDDPLDDQLPEDNFEDIEPKPSNAAESETETETEPKEPTPAE